MAKNKKANTKWRKDARRARALKRQEVRDSLSAKEQLALLDKRPGQSAKERARLEKLI